MERSVVASCFLERGPFSAASFGHSTLFHPILNISKHRFNAEGLRCINIGSASLVLESGPQQSVEL